MQAPPDQHRAQAQLHCIQQSPASLRPRSQSIPLFQFSCHQGPIHILFSQHLSTTLAVHFSSLPSVCFLNLCSTHQLNPLLFPLVLLLCRSPFKFLSQAYRQPEPHQHCNSPHLPGGSLQGTYWHLNLPLQIAALEHKAPASRRDARLSPWWGTVLLLFKACSPAAIQHHACWSSKGPVQATKNLPTKTASYPHQP